jgi:hypothetical protein
VLRQKFTIYLLLFVSLIRSFIQTATPLPGIAVKLRGTVVLFDNAITDGQPGVKGGDVHWQACVMDESPKSI